LALNQACKQCRTFFASGFAMDPAKPALATGLNQSLFDGKGQIHSQMNHRRQMIVDVCQQLEKNVKIKSIS